MARETIDDRYRLDERIATGGMAEVWAAYDAELDRPVALKLLLRSANPARFSREARAAAALSHPNICQLFDFGDADGRAYIVLEYLPGGTLEDRLPPGEPLPADDTARIASEIASGLAHAHARGLVHRDIKPGNVLFDSEGTAKITDFGIAQIEDVPTLTEAGTLLGTAAYMSPEQATAQRVTPATDVYSFGVILYRLLTGRLPFETESPLELAAMHASEEPAPILSVRPDAPPELVRVATAALAKRPEDRPADGAALLALLEAGGDADAETTLIAAPPTVESSRTEVIPPRPRSWARPVAIGGVLALLAATGATAALLASSGESEAPATEPPSSVRTNQTNPTTTDRATTNDLTRERTTTREPTTPRPTTSPPPAPAPPSPATTSAPPAPVPTQVTAPELPPVPTETPPAPLPTTETTVVPTTTAPTTIP
jgi:eukaryotic-like serine/threonine-protein kinase